MNYVKAKGFNLAALAIITIDNPMVAATGHRICNDCANACIYQKQEPVDIPLIESNILQEILLLPYGVEIYLLLTNWNPLNIFAPLPKPSTNYKILVAGIGPAGFSLCYYLLREGHIVVAIDGLKINPLLFDSDKPIKYWSEYQKNLSEKLPSGFGGVMEYGITPRWNKNNLVIIHLLLQRQSNFRLFGGVSLGNNIMIHQVISSNKWHSGQVKQKVKQEDIPSVLRFSKANFSKDKSINLGFDHLAICIGADTPKLITMKNFLAKGVRTASDILMTIQSGGAFLKESMTNLLIRMPIVIIGGGLTSIDVAVETLIYYKLQVEKFYKKYQTLVSKHGLDHTQENWTKEEQLIAEEFIAHAKLFAKASDKATTLNILKELGGATIFYKGKIKDSPAYRLNPDEMAYAMAMNIEFMEDMAPVGINVDQYEYAESIEFNNVKFNNLGIREKFRARTVIIAIGTENHHNFLKNIYGKLGLDGASLEEKITYFGDCNPLFAGSVVKAIASSKEGYKFIGAKLAKNEPVCDINPTNFFSKLKYLLTSSIKEVNIFKSVNFCKTDKHDAFKLAYHGDKMQLTANYLYQQESETLKRYQQRREDLVLMLGNKKKRLHHSIEGIDKKSIDDHIEFLQKEITEIDKMLNEIVDGSKELKEKTKILESIPGIGKCLASKLISFLPELGNKEYSSNELAAIVGIAPYARDSGNKKGR
ncbi:hypothetical protein Bhyg_00133, partial [Pseudolycoriella hygida]